MIRPEGVFYTSESTLVCCYAPGLMSYKLMKPTGTLGSVHVLHKGCQSLMPKNVLILSFKKIQVYIKEICDFVTFFFLFMISKFSSFARNTTLIKKCDTAAILRNEIFRLRVFSEGDSICVTLKNTNQNIVQYHLVFFGVCGLSEISTMFVVSFIYFLIRLRL